VATKLVWLSSKRNLILVVLAALSTASGLGDAFPTLGFWDGI
jgi:hypothetical protein